MKKINILILSVLVVLLFSCNQEQEVPTVTWQNAQTMYLESLTETIRYLDTLETLEFTDDRATEIFRKARTAFKKAEPYAAYLNPEVGHRANGPALPIFKEDSGKVIKPIGLQKIEESLFEGNESQAQFEQEVLLTKGLLNNLKHQIETKPLDAQRFFIATHQQLLRIISHSISGFDTPASLWGISESIISLQNLEEVYTASIQRLILHKDRQLNQQFLENIAKAIALIEKDTDFETFDRYTFIRDYFNPITRDWVEIRQKSGLWTEVDTKPFNFDAPTFFENNSFNTAFFTPAVNRNTTVEHIALGEKLFADPNLSFNGKMACTTCHDPQLAYTDGRITNLDNSGKFLERNTPTLINSVFQQNFFWDGRSPTLQDQVASVFTNEKEFAVNVHQFSSAILKDSTYTEIFENVFGQRPVRNTDLIKAISAYVSSLNGFNSKFDKNMRGQEATFTEDETLGMNLFMGKALCATCHFMPLTNGTVPPFFTETEREVIGVPASADNKMVDDDFGFYWMFKEALHWGMFKTPTVRNVALTAPYMHNGVYNTLDEVMDFYNKGGGAGLGFDLEHQTLPFDALNLSDKEQQAIIAFMKTLTDVDVEKMY
ncbi:cytochrome c peroxidase [Arenibacter sp. GZD96]|uniref:cytochrome-c peroxidase n=1 Tax=Aurantibrevibacter litoralis TaxID=3106030 RepID=UPI002AFF9B07|nr:cytochrome c peroxidase [Arenibacter sp. GZD-96]MEA1787341.1 cytochrome c peroxidase [Arenibacter sp. GZD-96]